MKTEDTNIIVQAYSEYWRGKKQLPFIPAIAMVSLTGSQGYGLAHEESDIDLRGFYIAPTKKVLSMENHDKTLKVDDPDMMLYEVDSFLAGLASNNPNMLELLFAPPVVAIPEAYSLMDIRKSFLTLHVRNSYGGYAKHQKKNALILANSPENRGRREKALRHAFRLQVQGYELVTGGDMHFRLQDPDRIRELSKLDDEAAEREFAIMDKRLMSVETDLPATPDYDTINEWLWKLRVNRIKSNLIK